MVVADVVDVVVRVGSVLFVALAGVFELAYLEGLLDEYVLNVIGEIVYFVLSLIIVLITLRLAQDFGLEVFYLDLVE